MIRLLKSFGSVEVFLQCAAHYERNPELYILSHDFPSLLRLLISLLALARKFKMFTRLPSILIGTLHDA
jgi:hypothetical protein